MVNVNDLGDEDDDDEDDEEAAAATTHRKVGRVSAADSRPSCS